MGWLIQSEDHSKTEILMAYPDDHNRQPVRSLDCTGAPSSRIAGSLAAPVGENGPEVPGIGAREPIGIIALGLVGTALAERLLERGFGVFGFDIDAARGITLTTLGGKAVSAPSEVFSSCQTIIISLPTSEIAAALLNDVAPALRPGQIVIDTTTGDPAQMVALGASLNESGVSYLEASIAGSSSQLRDGEATIFLSGASETIASCSHVLEAVSPRRFPLGPVGSASRFKLVHNLILGLHRAVLAEGLYFAESFGFDPQQALEILRQTSAASTVMTTKGGKMVTRDFLPQARLAQHWKDVQLILGEAERFNIPVPLTVCHCELLELAIKLGYADADNSAIIEAYRRMPNVEKNGASNRLMACIP